MSDRYRIPSWQILDLGPVYWSGRNGAAATVTLTGSFATISVNLEDETSGSDDFALASNELTVKKAGVYWVAVNSTYRKTVGNANVIVESYIAKNGTAVSGTLYKVELRVLNAEDTAGTARAIALAANDTLRIDARIASGTDVDTVGQSTSLSVFRIPGA